MTDVLQQLFYGLTVGSAYALMGIGFSLTWRAMRTINFAHGAVGALAAFIAAWLLVDHGIAYVPAAAIAIAAAGLCGLLLNWLVYQPLRRRGAAHWQMLVAFIAVALALQQSFSALWPAEGYVLPPMFGDRAIEVAGVRLVPQYILMAVVAVVVSGLLVGFFRTRVGKGLRAVADDRETAQLMGINVDMMNALTFGMSALLIGVAAIIYGPVTKVVPGIADVFLIAGFVAAALGGLNRIEGAMLGGLLFGVGEQFAAAYVSSEFATLIAFATLLLVIVVKPTGLLGSTAAARL